MDHAEWWGQFLDKLDLEDRLSAESRFTSFMTRQHVEIGAWEMSLWEIFEMNPEIMFQAWQAWNEEYNADPE